ncbi:hypothetical protein [Streptomyces rochei]|uniref:hypothetical protein n=1 Tax=Streptomyces rochei TaxID=1928 RepID=UPI00403A01C1
MGSEMCIRDRVRTRRGGAGAGAGAAGVVLTAVTRYIVRVGSINGSPRAIRPAAYSRSHSAVGSAA